MTGRSPASRGILTALVLLSLAVPAISQEAPKAAGGPPYRVGGEISRPEIVSSTRPIYTELARRARVTGTVIVEAVIDEHGDVTDARVLKGLPMGLSQAALDAIKAWKFRPAVREGLPVPVYYVLTVNFQVDGSPFGSGPVFAKFLDQNPEFAAALRDGRYEEAAALLDRSTDPAVPLARVFFLLERSRLQEAWHKALEMSGPDRYEGLAGVGAFAWKQGLDQGKDAKTRAEIIETGLQAEAAAMAENPDGVEAIRFKILLIQAKSDMTLDPQERQALAGEAEQLRRQAAELQKAKGEPRQD